MESGTLVGQSEVDQIREAMRDAERLRGERDKARDELQHTRFKALRDSVDGLAAHVGTQNGRIDSMEKSQDAMAVELSHIDGEKAGKALASKLFWRLFGTGIGLVGAAAAVGAVVVKASE